MNKNTSPLIIENTRASLVMLPSLVNDEAYELRPGIELIPGENNIDSDEWNRIKNHKTVKMWLDAKILVLRGEGEAKSYAKGLDTLEKHEALRQIAKCNSEKILMGWHDTTNNDGYRKNIKAKIADIKTKEEDV